MKIRLSLIAFTAMIGLCAQAQTQHIHSADAQAISLTQQVLRHNDTKQNADTIPHADLIQNGSFEEEPQRIPNRRFGPNGEGERFGGYPAPGTIPAWYMVNFQEAQSRIEKITTNLPDPSQQKALQWTIMEATSEVPAAIANTGYNGIKAVEGEKYTLTFWARATKRYRGKLTVGLQDKDDATWYAKAKVKKRITKRWKKYTVTLVPDVTNGHARFAIAADTPGVLFLDMVSLRPATIE